MVEHDILGFKLDDLAFRFLLIGLAVVAAALALLAVVLVCCCCCCRRGRAAARAAKVHAAAQQPHQITIEEAFGSESGKTQKGALTPSTVAMDQSVNGSSPSGANRFSHSPLPTGADYLDMGEGAKGNKNLTTKVLFAEDPEVAGHKTQKNGIPRKDTGHPIAQLKFAGEAQKWAMKDRPFTIIINDEMEEEPNEEHEKGPKSMTIDLKLNNLQNGPMSDHHQMSSPPTSPTRFVAKMAKLSENENERLYDEFEALNPRSLAARPRTTSAETSENIRKNRFYDVLPYEFNRVKLRWTSAYGGTDSSKSDYINASYIRTDDQDPVLYIAAQGPIGEEEADGGRRVPTVRDFWEMVWQESVDCVVMLGECIEGTKHKCAQYWPCSPGESDQLSDHFSIHLYCVTEEEHSIQRELWMDRNGHERRKILQWQFKEWRDSASRPEQLEHLLEFVHAVKASSSAKRRPILVHCSAGIGRTGVFIALDMLLDKLDKEQIIDVKQTVARLRSQREAMVQNSDQYVALYEAIAMAIRNKSRSYG